MDNNNDFYNPTLIHKVATNKAVVEIFGDCFDKDKVRLNFQSFEGGTNIQYYMNVGDFLALANDIKNGTAAQCMTVCSQSKRETPYKYLGGTPYEKQATDYKRADKRDESRIFSIIPSTKYAFTLKAEKGPGTKTGTGIIEPDYKAAGWENIIIPMSSKDAKAFFILGEIRYQAYVTAKMMQGAYEKNSSVTNHSSSTGRQEQSSNNNNAATATAPQANPKQAQTQNVVPIQRSETETQGKPHQSRYTKPAQKNEITPTADELFPAGSFEDMYPEYFNRAM